jgi:DHA1 family inner membrane transport protein
VYVTGEALPIGLLLPMAADLGVSATHVGLLVTAYGAVVVVATIPLTVMTRTVPRRPLLSVLLGGFVLTTVVAALADSFWLVLAMRMVGAATQALFWAVVVPAAAGLFRPELKGRAVAVVFAGSTVGLAGALPAATWLGQLAGWRVAFLAIGGVGFAAFSAVAALLPSSRPQEGHAARGAAPDARRFALLVAVATLGTTGALVAYTYIAKFITDVTGLGADSMDGILLARGVASLAGIALVAVIVDRWPRSVLTWSVAVQAAALLGLYAWGRGAVAAVVLFSVAGLAFAALTAAMGGRVLEVAPGRSEIAAAGVSTAVNVGISAGSLVGGLLLSGYGVRSIALVGALITLVALVPAIVEQRAAARPRTAPEPTPSPSPNGTRRDRRAAVHDAGTVQLATASVGRLPVPSTRDRTVADLHRG